MHRSYVTIEEAAAWLRVSVRTVQRLTARGALRSSRIGAARLYCHDELQRVAGGAEIDMRSPLLMPDEAASLLRLQAPAALNALVDEGVIDAIRVGRQMRFRGDLLGQILDERPEDILK